MARWSKVPRPVGPTFISISFDTKLEPETVLRHIPSPRHRIEPSFKRPALTGRMSEEERRWCETFLWDRPLPSVER